MRPGIVILADGNNASTFHDNYGDVNVRAPLVFEEGARLVMNYKTPLLGGASGRGVISAASGNDERIFAGEGAIAAGASAPTVGMLAMAAGSYVVANTTATINATTAAIDGVKVLVADATALAAGTTYSLVSATALSGTPEVYAVDSEGNHVSASNGKAKNWWLAKARGGVLRLAEGNPNAGMAVFIR